MSPSRRIGTTGTAEKGRSHDYSDGIVENSVGLKTEQKASAKRIEVTTGK